MLVATGRARITQIMQLRHLAPDIQEKILFLPNMKGINERNLRPVVRRIDWDEQRRIFARCNGLFYLCNSGAEARRFNRLLIDAGMIKRL